FETGTRAMKIYIDGVLEATATNQKGFVTPTQATLIIGARGTADDEYFNGLIDDIRVFDSLLTPEEILILAGAGRNEGAVYTTASNTSIAASWSQLLDPTGEIEDMSFMLFTSPLASLSVGTDTKGDTEKDSSETTTTVEEKK
ncbi:MAG: LamG domain-containing protein, partial [Phycisphaerales bacterium]